MTHSKELFSHCASVLGVSDMNRSLAFYRDKLGFTITFTWQEPVEYAVLKRGGVSLHLTSGKVNDLTPPDHTIIYIFVYDVAEVYRELQESSVECLQEPEARDYGMTDFDIVDPDGYILSFGNGS